MFPFNPNIPYIKKNGKRTTLGALLGLLPDITDELDTLDGRLDDAEDDIDTLEGKVTALETVTPLSLDLTEGFTFGGTFKKVGNLYILSGRCTSDAEITTSTTEVANIPLDAVPDNEIFGSVVTLNSNGQTGVVYIVRDTQAIKVSLNAALAATKPFYITLIWES